MTRRLTQNESLLLHWWMAIVTIKKRDCDYWWPFWTDLKIRLWLLVTTVDGHKNLLVTIDDHCGWTQKFACAYCWSIWTVLEIRLCLNSLDFSYGWNTGQLWNFPGSAWRVIFSRTGAGGELCCISKSSQIRWFVEGLDVVNNLY